MECKETQIEMIRDLRKIYFMPIPMLKGLDAWAPEIAEELIKLGWVKLSEDNVMLSREQLHDNEENAYQVGITMGKKFGGKKTAEEIILHEIKVLKELKNLCIGNHPQYQEGTRYCCDIILMLLKEHAKQFNIEIKEA